VTSRDFLRAIVATAAARNNPDQQWRNGRALPGWAAEDGCPHMVRCRPTLFSCYTDFVTIAKSKAQLRNVTVTLEEDVAKWARIEAARRDTSVSRLLGELLKEQMASGHDSAKDAAERLAGFGKRHKLSLRGLKIKDLINEGRP